MPIVDIEFVSEIPGDQTVLTGALANAIADALQTGIAQTWVRLRSLPRSCYAENGVEDPPGAGAVFVAITKRFLTDEARLAEEAERVCAAIAKVSGRAKEHIHIIYEPPGNGRIAFGGKLLR